MLLIAGVAVGFCVTAVPRAVADCLGEEVRQYSLFEIRVLEGAGNADAERPLLPERLSLSGSEDLGDEMGYFTIARREEEGR